jgi:COPII coat assembly protein SEC16
LIFSYLLSPITSVFSGIGAPGLRHALFGSADPMVSLGLLPIILSELVEFAKSLVPAVKGQEPFHGYPHLQAYRLWHATCLAEMGEIALAKRYASGLRVDCLLKSF